MTKAKKKTIKKVKFAKNIVYIGLSITMLVGLFTTGLRVLKSYYNYKETEQAHHALVLKKEEMKKEAELLKNDDYLVIYARKNYVFTRDNEDIARLPDEPQK